MLVWIPGLDRRWLLRARIHAKLPHDFDYWLHGASLGEIQVCLKIAELLCVHSEVKILLTCQTKAAFEMLQGLKLVQIDFCLMPLDGSVLIDQCLSKAKPKAVFVYESEFWPCFIQACKGQGVSVYWLGVRVGSGLQRLLKLFPHSMRSILSIYKGIGLLDSSEAYKFKGLPVLPGSWDLKMLGGLSVDTGPRNAKALLSWHVEEIAVGVGIVQRHPSCIWYVQLRKSEQKNRFREFWIQKGFMVRVWPEKPNLGEVCLVANYGTTADLLDLCGEVWMGGGFAKTSHSPREALKSGAIVWVGPHLPQGDAQFKTWKELGVLGVCDSSGGQLLAPSSVFDIENQYQELLDFFAQFN